MLIWEILNLGNGKTNPNSNPLLSIANLIGGYDETLILNGVDLSLNSGESLAIIGPNGAGKSTVMKAIFGMIRIDQGEIIFAGENISKFKPNKIVTKGISYVPQVANIFTELTIEENLQMGGFLIKNGLDDAFDYVYNLFPDLKKMPNKLAGTLSGGQRQMLAMARALMLFPKLLLLDEPTAGLSPKYMDHIFAIVKDIQSKNVAVLMVEQHARQALEFVDYGLVLVLGKNAHFGKADELLHNQKVIQAFLGG